MSTGKCSAWKKGLSLLSFSWVLGSFFIMAGSYADTPTPAPQHSIEQNKALNSKALLGAIIAQIKISDPAQGSFEQRKYIHILPQPLLSKGLFQLDKKTGLVWQITEPVASRIVFDSAGIHQSKNGQAVWEVSNEQPGVAMIGQLLRAALSYDWALLESYFSISGAIEEHTNKPQWTLTLSPKENTLQQSIKHISLAGGQQLTQVILFEVNNDRTEINLNML